MLLNNIAHCDYYIIHIQRIIEKYIHDKKVEK